MTTMKRIKRALYTFVVIVIGGVIAYLGVTRYFAERRADRYYSDWQDLEMKNMEADTRIMELESDLETANARIAELTKAQTPAGTTTTASSAPSAPATASAPSTPAQPVAAPGALVRYAATAAPGLTNTVRIEGTSSVHEWQVESHMIGGSAEFPPGFPPAAGVDPLPGPVAARASVFIPARSLKSIEKDGRPYSDPMDEIMYGKLLAETNKRITYALNSLTPKPLPGSSNAGSGYEATGLLAVAGVTNPITMPVVITPGPDGKLQLAGSVDVKMTDFNIIPPAPSVGPLSIKTGTNVTLRFNWWVKPVQPR